MRLPIVILVIGMFFPGVGSTQEVRYIDLTDINQPVADRPTTSRVDYSICEPSEKPFPHQARSSLEAIDSTDLYPHQRVEIEVRVENAGTGAIALPIYPNLTDLKPDDPSKGFEYYSLRLYLDASFPTLAIMLGRLELYAVPSRPETFVTLQPGEWIRVKGNIFVQRWFKNDRNAIASTDIVLYRYMSSGDQKNSPPRKGNCILPVDGATIKIQVHPKRYE